MERNANYALVGLTSVLLIIGLIVFSVWLSALKIGRAYDQYDIAFKGPVRGLTQGGEVHFNGIKVGEVTSISLDTVDPTLVIARIDVTSDVPIRVDSYAMLEPQGITGLNYVLITAGTPSLQLLKEAQPQTPVPLIHSRPSALSDLFDGGSTVLVQAGEALDRINRVLSDQNIEHLNNTLDDIQVITAELRDRKSIIAEAERTLVSANEAAQQVSELAESGNSLINGDAGPSITNLRNATRDLSAMMKQLQGPVADFAVTGLPQILAAAASLQQAADNLDRTLNEVKQNPQGLVGKPPAQEIEVKP